MSSWPFSIYPPVAICAPIPSWKTWSAPPPRTSCAMCRAFRHDEPTRILNLPSGKLVFDHFCNSFSIFNISKYFKTQLKAAEEWQEHAKEYTWRIEWHLRPALSRLSSKVGCRSLPTHHYRKRAKFHLTTFGAQVARDCEWKLGKGEECNWRAACRGWGFCSAQLGLPNARPVKCGRGCVAHCETGVWESCAQNGWDNAPDSISGDN